jgi:hypothetical protein
MRASALPFLLTAVVSFAIGLTGNRLLHETSTLVGTPTFGQAPSWLGMDAALSCADKLAAEEALFDDAEVVYGLSPLSEEVVVDPKRAARDAKMDALVVKFGWVDRLLNTFSNPSI